MIYVELNGRFGNYLFQIATAASLAAENKTSFAVVCHDRYKLPGNVTVSEYVEQFRNNIFNGITFINNPPAELNMFSQEGSGYTPIIYKENIYLFGTFQSEKYFNPEIARSIFRIPERIRKSLMEKYGNILSRGVTALHVRRGDYLQQPHEYNITSMRFFRKAIKQIGQNSEFLIISDDIEWCKRKFKGDNFFFTDANSALEDFYLQSLCKNNIISNSTFSWWGAFLNPNPDKIVIAPDPWYGKSFAHINTEDLIPAKWIKIRNRMAFKMQLKAKAIVFKKFRTKKIIEFKQVIKRLIYS